MFLERIKIIICLEEKLLQKKNLLIEFLEERLLPKRLSSASAKRIYSLA